MAEILNGINGAFSGKIGPVVGFSRNGKNFARAAPKKTKKKPSQKQLDNRKAMASAQQWLKYITPIVRIGFKYYSANQHGFGNALSYLKLNAITEDFKIDPAKAMISWGSLAVPASPLLHNPEPCILEFTWEQEGGNWNDHVFLLIYFTGGTHYHHIANLCGNTRKTGRQLQEYTPEFSGMEADVYLGFITEERDECSNSLYLGRVKLS